MWKDILHVKDFIRLSTVVEIVTIITGNNEVTETYGANRMCSFKDIFRRNQGVTTTLKGVQAREVRISTHGCIFTVDDTGIISQKRNVNWMT